MSFTFTVVPNVTQPNNTGTQIQIGGGLAPAFNALNQLVNVPPPPPSPVPPEIAADAQTEEEEFNNEEAREEEPNNNPNN